jgi:hypothetical protein
MNLSQSTKKVPSKFGVNIHLEHFSYFMVVSSSKKLHMLLVMLDCHL